MNPYVYKDQLKKECQLRAKKVSTTIYGICYASVCKSNTNPCNEEERYIIACSSNGIICIWDTFMDDAGELLSSSSCSFGNHSPSFSFKVCDGILYDVKFVEMTSSSSSLLITCGECGVYVYCWDDIWSVLSNKNNTTASTFTTKNAATTILEMKPISVMHTHPTASSVQLPTEVNRISYDEVNSYLYGASGDFFGGYIWDINTSSLLGTLGRNTGIKGRVLEQQQHRNSSRHRDGCGYHLNYLHTIKAVSSTHSPSNHLVLTGDDGGKIGIWNGKDQKLIQMIDCKSAIMECYGNGSGNGSDGEMTPPIGGKFATSDKDSTLKHINDASMWVSSLDVDESCQWSVIGGGIEHGHQLMRESSYLSKQLDNGFLALMNLQTRTLCTFGMTYENIHDVAFNENSKRIVSVGNHNAVSFWGHDLSQGRVGHASVSSPSSYTIGIQKAQGGMIAVGGVGLIIDCYSQFGTKSSTLNFGPSCY